MDYLRGMTVLAKAFYLFHLNQIQLLKRTCGIDWKERLQYISEALMDVKLNTT